MNICLYGHTENKNYGGLLTYYSLYLCLKRLGYDPIIIPRSCSITSGYNVCEPDSASAIFFREHCDVAQRLPFDEFYKYNELSDIFMVGSDMIWNHRKYRYTNDTWYLNFVNDDKKKIACSTSFGNYDFNELYECNQDEIDRVNGYLHRFDSISLREKEGIGLVKEHFSMDVDQIIDPVFYTSINEYESILNTGNRLGRTYDVFFYMVHPKSRDFAMNLNLKGKTLIEINDGHRDKRTIYDWFSTMINCRSVITDSFHGVCFCLLFNKPFIFIDSSWCNGRMDELNRTFGLDGRLFKIGEYIPLDLLDCQLDWKTINGVISNERQRAETWIRNAIVG